MHLQPGTTVSRGFTLIELVLVLVILGTLSAYALPRWEPADTTVAAQADRLARDLRHAQALAMNQGRTLRFDVQSPAAYRVTDASGTTVTDPADQQAFQVSLDNNVTLGGSDTEFDSLGRPVSAGSLLAADRDFTLNGNAATATVTLSAVTGFVVIAP
jgi:prepilin-type N-terminal cleavage/methylation domain-containing protein